MNIIWLGHSGFRIEIGDQVLLVDPWLTGNPMFPADRRDEAIKGATHILISHGHGDHTGDAMTIGKAQGIKIACIHELSVLLTAKGAETIGFGKGGTITLGNVKVTLVNATHSSSLDMDGIQYAGTAGGFMIAGEGHTIYFTGDTDVMADMGVFNDLHKPDIGILCAGGHYTMDMKRAAYAANTFFNFKTIIPCHYRTFPLLAQNADDLVAAVTDAKVIEPEVLKPIAF